jgi:3',5'-cyclic AMP phosphodiesterase CpdA
MSDTFTLTRRQLLSAALGTSVLAAMPARAAETPVRRRALRIAHLTDVHVQPEKRGGEGFAAALRHAQNQSDKPELVVFGGDNVMNVDGESGSARAGVQLDLWHKVRADECGVPHLTAVGNHDVRDMHPVDGKKWALDAYALSNRYYTHDQAGWRLIFLDSTMPIEGGYTAKLDDEQFEWLHATLTSTPASTHICIVSHIPIIAACAYFDGENERSGNWNIPGSWVHIDARRIKDLFHKHPNVRLCLSGHMHLADEITYLGVKYACNGAVCGNWWDGAYHEFHAAYALVDLYDDGSSSVNLVDYGWRG